ncbi:hypothetical protein PG994_012113 [Apiospora phragmitis]|uniref:Uncharacterized protein n=1 Tax=Apiospora phragmitis TaxID=2905665 RepID=A0ABR1TUT1_9PEZI
MRLTKTPRNGTYICFYTPLATHDCSSRSIQPIDFPSFPSVDTDSICFLETVARISQALRLAYPVQVDLVGDAAHEPVARLALVPGFCGGAQQIPQEYAVAPLAPGRAALVVVAAALVVGGCDVGVNPAHGHAVARRHRRLLVGQVPEEAGARVGPRQRFGGAGHEVVAAGGGGSSGESRVRLLLRRG